MKAQFKTNVAYCNMFLFRTSQQTFKPAYAAAACRVTNAWYKAAALQQSLGNSCSHFSRCGKCGKWFWFAEIMESGVESV